MKSNFRKTKDLSLKVLYIMGVLIAIAPLVSVLWTVVREGYGALTPTFFTNTPAPVGEVGGGIAHAIIGSFVVVGLASIVAIPWGIILGIARSEFPKTITDNILGFAIDLFMSIPTLLIGLFAYGLIVMRMRTFSAWSGAFALMLIMVPLITKTTEEMLKQVPLTVREAGLALGLPRWKVILRIILPGSIGAVSSGVLLALARISGETAPLLFTAFGMRTFSQSLSEPIATLPVQIYTYSISPYDEWRSQSWGAALVLVMLALVVNGVTRALIGSRTRGKK
ncbi:MAG: phosphate ABC transporter permease PstA [Xanthomonadaceae bacterium]|nr:phosphate ABC transporter permease PstA [Xanthomonadaceae bacterium]